LVSILNTIEEEVEIVEPPVELKEIDNDANIVASTSTVQGNSMHRDREVLEKLRMELLNPEEKESLKKLCFDYQDLFYLPGDRLNCTNAVKHTIDLVPGTAAIHTRPYRLPETQKQEADRQVHKLLQEGIIEESYSPWKSPILIVPKKVEVDGEKKWKLVVDFRGLNEKNCGRSLSAARQRKLLTN
jgi:hypothetical protein